MQPPINHCHEVTSSSCALHPRHNTKLCTSGVQNEETNSLDLCPKGLDQCSDAPEHQGSSRATGVFVFSLTSLEPLSNSIMEAWFCC